MALYVALINFPSHGCLNPIFRWNSGPNLVSSIIVKLYQVCACFKKLVEDAWLYILLSRFKEVSAMSELHWRHPDSG